MFEGFSVMDHKGNAIEVDEPDETSQNPFLPFQMMEGLLEKLKLLDYEHNYCRYAQF